MSSFKNQLYMLEDFIDLVKQKKDRSARYDPDYYYNIYAAEADSWLPLRAGMKIYVGESVQVNDDDEEIYPPDVLEMGFAFVYSDENFQSVIDLAMDQCPTATYAQLIECLNHYSSRDCFLDIVPG